MTPPTQTTVPTPPPFVGWLYTDKAGWQVVASGDSYAEAAQRLDDYLAALDDAPKHSQVYVGRVGNRPPMARGR